MSYSNQPGDYRSCRLLRDAVRLGFRSSAGPFRSFGRIAVEPRPYQLVPRLALANDQGVYSLIDFRGADPSGFVGTDTSDLIPFIDTAYFQYAYGQTSAGERIIDSPYASSTPYVADTDKLFGVNFADGRINGMFRR